MGALASQILQTLWQGMSGTVAGISPTMNHMKRLLFGWLAMGWALFAFVEKAPGQCLIYTNETDFVTAAAGSPTFLNDFTNDWYDFGQWIHPLWAGNGSAGYWLTTIPALNLVTFDGAVSTYDTNDEILIHFASSNVVAVGGWLYSADADAVPATGTVTLLLNDGTTTNVDSEVGGQPAFIGFFSTGPIITSLVVSNAAGGGYPALAHFYAVADPTPAIALTSARTAVVSWAATPARYVLQVSSSPNGQNWVNAGATIQQAGGRIQALVPTSNTMGFFRLSHL